MKRKIAALAAAILASVAVAGCGIAGDSDGAQREKVRLMVWSPSEDQSKESGEWLQTTCEQFA